MDKFNNVYYVIFTMVVICSFNCNGLKCVKHFQNLVSIIDDRRFSIVLLQETFWNDSYIDSIKHLYEGNIICSNGLNDRQGVAILVNNYCKDKTNFVYSDENGRFLHVTFEESGKLYNIISLYAPNDTCERTKFFEFVGKYTENLENIVIGGDFNTSLSSFDRGSKTKHVINEPCKRLLQLIDDNDVYDVWRTRNAHSKVFSWKRISNNELQQSRIDYFLVSKQLSTNIQNVFYNVTSLSDHAFVIMNINCNNIERGPGLWILNNTLLHNEQYIRRVREMIETEKENELYDRDILVWWDNLKYKIKKYSQILSSTIAKENKRDYYKIEKQINNLCEKASNGIDIDISKLESLKLELSNYELGKCRGAVLRSKAIWAVESDKNTKYFLNLEKYKQENNSVKELLNENNESVTDTEGILDLQHDFYRKLYSCVETENDKMEELLDSVDVIIDDNDCELCNSDISHEEIINAINQMSKNKSPGSDGLTVEFYCQFYNDLRNVLMKLFNSIENEGTLSRSMKCGVISLIYKKKGDRRSLKNYRPISLLQVDYKILARIMANRFKTVLPNIISVDQTCCIMGRDISNNVANVRDIIELIERDNLEGYIIKIDQEKAFDRVSHAYLLRVLQKYGFGEKFVKWIEIFYNGINSAVKCNGFLTKYFSIKNGIRQGCPISALLYVLTAEPLHCKIVKNNMIQGIAIPNCEKEGLIFQHADDTTLSVRNKQSISEVFKEFDLYGKATGARINKAKSEILCVGKGELSTIEKKGFGLQICENNLQLLGVYIGKDQNICNELNWKIKINKVKSILNMWLQRHLTIQGRVIVVNTLMMSRFWYTLFVSSMPEWAYVELKKLCVDFVWNKKSHLVKYSTLIDLKCKGGMQLADLKCKIYAFRLKFLCRLIDDEYNVLWKYTFKYFISKIYNMNLGLDILFINVPNCELKCIPIIYKEMLEAWYILRQKSEFSLSVENIYDQPLFKNPEIVLKGKTILWYDFIHAGIISIKDISYEVTTGFLPDRAIVEMIQSVCDNTNVKHVIERYHSLISVIPEDWKHTIQTEVHNRNTKRTIDIYISNNNIIATEMKLCSVKKLYQYLIEDIVEEPTGPTIWKLLFDIDDSEFDNIWLNVNMFWKPAKMIELDYKIVHNCIFTKCKLKKIGLVDNKYCDVCGIENEDILHIFINCEELEEFHDYISMCLEKLFQNCDSNRISLIKSEIILLLGLSGKMKGVNEAFVNFFLSTARYCIFKRRNVCTNGKSNINLVQLFRYTLKHYVIYFYEYMCQRNKMNALFQKKFLLNNPLVQETENVICFEL